MNGCRIACLAVVLAATGCVLPVPIFPAHPADDDHRGNFVDPAVPALARGAATRTDVLLACGEPDLCTGDTRRIAYLREVPWLTFLIFAPGGATGIQATRHRALVVDFDESGVLQGWHIVDQSRLGVDATWLRDLGRRP